MELTPELEAITGRERANILEGLRARLLAHPVLLKFALMGATGYIVYQLVFFIFYDSSLLGFLPEKGQTLKVLGFSHGDARLLIATLVAAELSIVGVFTGHHLWTFRERLTESKPLWVRFGQFNSKAAVSSLGILTAVVNLLTLALNVTPYLTIPIGVAAAFLWNWRWDSRFIWRPVETRNEGS